MKGSIFQEEIIIPNIYIPNKRSSKCMKQTDRNKRRGKKAIIQHSSLSNVEQVGRKLIRI